MKDKKKEVPTKKPNEAGAVSVEGHIKIFDPNTKEVFVNELSSTTLLKVSLYKSAFWPVEFAGKYVMIPVGSTLVPPLPNDIL